MPSHVVVRTTSRIRPSSSQWRPEGNRRRQAAAARRGGGRPLGRRSSGPRTAGPRTARRRRRACGSRRRRRRRGSARTRAGPAWRRRAHQGRPGHRGRGTRAHRPARSHPWRGAAPGRSRHSGRSNQLPFVDLDDGARLGRDHHRQISIVRGRGVDRIQPVELLAAVVADEVDQPAGPKQSAGVLHEEEKAGDARQHEDTGDDDREARDHAAALIVDLPEHEQGVDEGGPEQPDGQLAAPVVEQCRHDARRELAHGQLHRYGGDRQHQAAERHALTSRSC